MATLLEKAKLQPVRHAKLGPPTEEELELVIALFCGKVTWMQASKVIGKKTGSIDAYCAGTLRRAVRSGMAEITIRRRDAKSKG